MIETAIQLATLVSVAGGVVGLVLGIRIYRRQTNAQIFLEYTKRYQETMSAFPEPARTARLDLEGEPPAPSQELTLAVLRYLNLCSEEFYLYKRGYLLRDIWLIWEDELKRTLRSPLLRREWQQLKREEDETFSQNIFLSTP